jgi:hypothetical protein
MSNLLKETLEILEENNRNPSQVRWVGSIDGKYAISWDEFAKVADLEYDSSYGWQEIADDLVVVGSNWWLERHEYDGSEWWEYKTTPKKSAKPISFEMEDLHVYAWHSLGDRSWRESHLGEGDDGNAS